MSDFEENFEIPAASEVDPAAEFLAKEQVVPIDNLMDNLILLLSTCSVLSFSFKHSRL